MTDEERRIYQRKYYAEHREKLIARTARYRQANPEKYRASCAAYREANRERIRERDREYKSRKKAEIWNSLKKGNENGTRTGT